MKPCPFCAEEIQDRAKVCKHCGRDLKPKQSILAWGCLTVIILGVLGGERLCSFPSPPSAPSQQTASSPQPPATLNVARPSLPGLTSGVLRVNLEQRGLTCSGPRAERTTASWLCEGQDGANVSYRVEFLGAPTRIEYVTATVLQVGDEPDDRLAATFLGFVATVPYDGAEPDQVRAWVEARISSGREIRIGPATFRLTGEPRTRSLSSAPTGSAWLQ